MAALTSGDDMISFDTTDWRWVPQRFLLELATDGNEDFKKVAAVGAVLAAAAFGVPLGLGLWG